MYSVIDAHAHIYPEKISNKAVENLGSFYDIKIGGKGTYADFEKTSNDGEKIAVRGFLLLNVATNTTQVRRANAYVAETVNLSRSRGFDTYGFMGIHQDCADFASELDAGVAMGLKGVKIHPDIQGVDIDDKRLLELYSLIEGKLPVYFHIGDDRPQYRFSSADKLVRVMRLFPRLEVIQLISADILHGTSLCLFSEKWKIFVLTLQAVYGQCRGKKRRLLFHVSDRKE